MIDDRQAVARGRQTFIASGCTGCHNPNQARAVPTTIHGMARIFAGDRPMMLAPRTPPLNPVLNTPTWYFDDKMAVVNASHPAAARPLAQADLPARRYGAQP